MTNADVINAMCNGIAVRSEKHPVLHLLSYSMRACADGSDVEKYVCCTDENNRYVEVPLVALSCSEQLPAFRRPKIEWLNDKPIGEYIDAMKAAKPIVCDSYPMARIAAISICMDPIKKGSLQYVITGQDKQGNRYTTQHQRTQLVPEH